ncbi:MAG: NFACT family protein [Cyanobacteria bacterium HKST-UBA02]|nr:NFACT family protein [Cyanobacteria bacterium HKST-UBA02]
MQPFDALSIRAVLQEAKPLLLNRKVDKVYQLARDEIIIDLRSKGGNISVFLSAQSVYGRMCLVRIPSSKDSSHAGEGSIYERYKSKYGNNQPPNFCMVLRKHLTGATLIGVDQLTGERIVDFVFSCLDEVGTPSIKILTAEIMGRHSNLIFWEKESKKILSSSHAVTREMSRQREVLPNLPYQRPPGQDRPNVFALERQVFEDRLAELAAGDGKEEEEGSRPRAATLEQWLLHEFTGLGKHLSEEIVAGSGLKSRIAEALKESDLKERLWEKLSSLKEKTDFKPLMRTDLDRYTLLGWYPDSNDESLWTSFTTVNDLVEHYFRALEAREAFVQLREKIKAEIAAESGKLESRLQVAEEHMQAEGELEELKTWGHMILSNLNKIQPGQTDLEVENWSEGNGGTVTIKLNPQLSGRQNAQHYYTQYAKTRARKAAASGTVTEVGKRLAVLEALRSSAENAADINELRKIKDTLSPRRQAPERSKSRGSATQTPGKPRSKQRILNFKSSEGWTIYVGRNRHENDVLMSKIANPNDLWLHVLGQGGAHVLIRVSGNRQDPPKQTLTEAAQVAARFSRAAAGSTVRVVYTRCKFVKKVDPKKPGMVRYENEKTLEIDTSQPMPGFIRRLFQ